ncbi:MAG: DUF4286 family protein [Pseudomonadota bacterium]
MSAPVVYEVNLEYRGEDGAGFDAWLEHHVEEMLAIDGFVGATISNPGANPGANSGGNPGAGSGASPEGEAQPFASVQRTVQYRLDNQASLDDYLERHAARMRADGQARYGEALSATRRVLTGALDKQAPAALQDAPRCRNCGAALMGQYCATCGQRDKHRMISLLELFRDFIGDLFELDSRIWRSLVPLLFRPGLLTLEYLSGRRVRYTPPLRMYLVLSLVFFVVVTTGQDINFEDGDNDDMTPEERQEAAAEAVEALQGLNMPQQVIDDIEAEILEAGEDDNPDDEDAPTEEDGPDAATDDDTQQDGIRLSTSDGEFMSEDCKVLGFSEEMEWLNTPAVVDRLEGACERLKTDVGREAFAKDLLSNVPTMMFVFLPIIALVMKFLYIGSRRYYVEHLLFFVHFHSFYYLFAAITVAVARLPEELFFGQGAITSLLIAALILYSPYYLFRSMRVVYAQHFLFTFAKFLVLNVAYFTGLLMTFAGTVVVTALVG